MKRVILIFGVLSLLVFIRPVLGLNTNTNNAISTTADVQADEDTNNESFISEALDGINRFYSFTGFANAQGGNILMIFIGIVFIYLGIKFDYEPLLLIPIGTGVIIGNIPFVAGYQTGIYETGSVLNYLYFGVVKGVYPPLIFLGIGAMTDFSSLIANPKLMLLGAAAQIGVFGTFLGALYLGFSLPEAGAIGIIGGADGPTAIFLSSKLANGVNILPDGTTVKNLIGPIAIAAYSYMALVPVIQPPIMRLLTSKKERLIRMKPPRAVTQKEKMIFPVVALLLTTFISPSALPLLGMLFFGNLLKESGRTERLADTARTKLIDIVTILLGVTVGASTQADIFLTADSMKIFALGAISFVIATMGGLMFAKFMNLFLKGDDKLNPLIGASGVSAVPDSARVVHAEGIKADPHNYLLMHAMAPNVAGVIGSAIAAGIILSFLG
ncbi:sodium ion-translocating decarboxylase subunit beta [Mariniflexile sp.]|uniref:sodium ion-translocating decarboxylase subunit beta n=1 Tax=Mariniflexile sp. TaxID=1979402 RepID=UPI003565FD60